MSVPDRDLADRRILIVEDEYFLAAELEEELGDAGALVIGPAPSVEQALALIEDTPDLDGAMLDVNLGDERAFPIADRLMAKGVPFMFVTGYQGRDTPDRYAHAPRIEKPFGRHAVAAALTQLLKPEPMPL